MKNVDTKEISECGQFAIILKYLLSKKNMTQGDLASSVGISKATVTHYVRGQCTPSQRNVVKIAECLGVSPQIFYGEPDDYHQYITSTETVFSTRFSNIIKEKGITQEDLAKQIGVSRQTINYYANGKQIPKPYIMLKIAKFFNTSIESLLEDNDNAKKTCDMKLIVSEMPSKNYECMFARYDFMQSKNGDVKYKCNLGGNCDFDCGECSKIGVIK